MSHAETCPLGGCGNCKLIDERDTLVRDLADARERLRVLTQFVNRQSCVVCRQPFDANVPRACPRCAPIRAAALAPFADAGVATCPRCAAFLVCEQHAPPAGAAPNETAIGVKGEFQCLGCGAYSPGVECPTCDGKAGG